MCLFLLGWHTSRDGLSFGIKNLTAFNFSASKPMLIFSIFKEITSLSQKKYTKNRRYISSVCLILEYLILLHCHSGIVSGVCNIFFNLIADSLNVCIFYTLLHNIFKQLNPHNQSLAQGIPPLLVYSIRVF